MRSLVQKCWFATLASIVALVAACGRGEPSIALESPQARQQPLDTAGSWEWSQLGGPPGLEGLVATYDQARRRGVVFGGRDADAPLREVWETRGEGWQNRSPEGLGPAGRSHAALAYDPIAQRSLLFGGFAGATVPLRELWEWDGRRWTSRTPDQGGPAPRGRHAMAYDLARRQLVLFGGSLDVSTMSGETWEWDGDTWSERTPAAGGPRARNNHTMAYDAERGKVVLFGGSIAGGEVSTRELWEWDGDTWTERTTADAGPVGRWGAGAVYDPHTRRVLVFGGRVADGTDSNELWAWDGAVWTNLSQTLAPPGRRGHAIFYDAERRSLEVIGGRRGNDYLDDRWSWDGERWTDSSVSSSIPPARSGHRMTYDTARQRVVMVGGARGTTEQFILLDDVWEWDGWGWIERTPEGTRPAARFYGELAFDAARGKTVLFGGAGGAGGSVRFGDTWEWDGSAWNQRSPAHAPSPRAGHGIAYDVARGKTVLFGGLPDGGVYSREVWEWDGEDWSNVTPAQGGPLGRSLVSAAYDPNRQRVILYGGLTAQGYGRDLWAWDGQSWELLADDSGPPPRSASVVFDASTDQLLVVSTSDGSTQGGRSLVWTWREDGWRELLLRRTPRAERDFTVVYDARQQRPLMFGGSSLVYLDETWVLGLRGAPCTSAADSSTGFCVDGVSCDSAQCATCETCGAAGNEGYCSAVTLADDPDTCNTVDGKTCDRQGACKATLGSAVDAAEQCASGFLVDGVCCETSSCGFCLTCNAAEKDIPDNAGRCGTQRAGSDLRDECSATSAESCGQDGSCDGRGSCRLHVAGTACGPVEEGANGLSGRVCTGAGECQQLEASCDGNHTLVVPGGESVDCGAYRCEGAVCKTVCANVADCALGHVCDEDRRCVPIDEASGDDAGCACTLGARPARNELYAVGLPLLGLLLGLRRRRARFGWRRWLALGAVPVVGAACTGRAIREESSHATDEVASALGATEPAPQWIRTGTPSARTDGMMSYDPVRQRVVMFGGFNGGQLISDYLRDIWEWDGTRWTERSPASGGPAGRSNHAVAYDSARRRLVLFGGTSVDSIGRAIVGDTWEWDGQSWQRFGGVSPSPRESAAMSYDTQRGRVVLFGGYDGVRYLRDIWEWDGTTWTDRTPATGGPPMRAGHAMAYDEARQRTLVLQGYTAADGYFADVWEWDGSTWTDRTPTSGAPSARSVHAAVYDSARQRVVMFGGRNQANVLRDIWEWDGQSWSNRTPSAGGPSARRFHEMAYDPLRQRVVLFGGDRSSSNASPNFSRETWEWDGTAWIDRTGGTGHPVGRVAPAMSGDSARERVVMFGGQAVSGYLRETWEWDGIAWTDRTPSSGGPSARFATSSVYDEARQRTLLFGGYDGDYLGDTWEWDGSAWTQRDTQASAPSPRAFTSLAYDRQRAKVVLFGGEVTGATTSGDLWEWDGDAWTAVSFTGAGPSPRFSHAASYDPVRGKMMLFGGFSAGEYSRETWEWDGRAWTDRTPAVGGPSGHLRQLMVFDEARARTVLVAGPGSLYGQSNETWIWDGDTWTDLQPLRSPWVERNFAVAFDHATGHPLLFGGHDLAFVSDETWRLDGRGAPCTSDADATTGFCVDGVSCETSACPGTCQACNTAEAPGRCAPVLLQEDPDTCQAEAGLGCDREGRCKAALGQLVDDAEDCISGFLVDGVCCETASCDVCSTCKAANKEIPDNDGRCGTQRAGSDLHDDCAEEPAASCGNEGSCDGRGACRKHPQGTACTPANGETESSTNSGWVCSGGGVCQLVAASCEDEHTVLAPNGERTDCRGFRCVEASCQTRCDDVSDCVAGYVCDENQQCVRPRPEDAEAPGCSCRSAGASASSRGSAAWMAVLGAGVVVMLRRRARRGFAPGRTVLR